MPTKRADLLPGDNVPPRFHLPRIHMKSVLEPELILDQRQVIASIPPVIDLVDFETKPNSCRLPFQEPKTLSSKGGRSKNNTSLDRERDQETKSKLNRQLHDEHRVFFANLKLERQMKFQMDTSAAGVIQRCFRGFAVRRRMQPEKFDAMRKSMQKRYTLEEMFGMVEEALRRSGVVLDSA